MKLFLKKLLYFILPIATFIAISVVIYYKRIDNLQLDKNTTTIICGDSHTMRGLNDSLINNSINISQAAETYLYTYNVLTEILSNNSNIKQIILGCSFQNFGKGRDNGITNTSNTNEMYIRYFTILNSNSRDILIKENWLSTLNAIPSVYKAMLASIILNYTHYKQYTFVGQYEKANANNLSEDVLKSVIKKHFAFEDKFDGIISNYQITYINKIVELCNDKKINLILLSTPLNYRYKNKIPQKNIFFFDKEINTLTHAHHVSFWDYSSYKMEDKYFEDPNHLNTNGATIFSKIIDQKLKELPQK